jgi:hypothetical protein
MVYRFNKLFALTLQQKIFRTIIIPGTCSNYSISNGYGIKTTQMYLCYKGGVRIIDSWCTILFNVNKILLENDAPFLAMGCNPLQARPAADFIIK